MKTSADMKTPAAEPWYASGDPWVLAQNAWDPARSIYYETIFTQSNGYLGVRGYTEETQKGVAEVREGYLAGVFGHIDGGAFDQVRVNYPWPMLAMITLPELFACELELDGEAFRLGAGTVASFRRALDMRDGVLTRELEWISPRGQRTRLCFERFLSAAVPHLGLQRITVTPANWNGPAVLRFALDGAYPTYFRCGDRAMPHLPQQLLQDPRIETDGRGYARLTLRTRGTGHTVAVASELAGGACASSSDASVARQMVTLALRKGEPGVMLHSVAVVSSRDQVEPGQVPALASEIARAALTAGYEASRSDSKEVWEDRWAASDIRIEGPARDQAYLRFSAFSMLQMGPFHTDNLSIPARAYAYNRYHGLYYWDSETFLLPHYLHTHPEVAEHLLRFRYRTLDGARRTARRLNAPGACYPWMTDAEEGNEQAPWGIGDYVWHQNADIAYAIDQYAKATGDTRFMLDQGLEVMVESARFWMSRLEEDAAGVVHLHDTVGPDELDKHGRDNGYTSLMARHHLRLAVRWAEKLKSLYPREGQDLAVKLELGARELASWTRAADRLAVPMVPGQNFPLQDEFLLAKQPLSFEGLTADEAFAKRHTHRVVKQADIIVAMYLLQDQFTVEQMRAAYDFYEPMTLHYSSLSYNTHSIIASWIGRERQAYDYFMKAAGLDLDNLRDATSDGLHAAALGGTWQTVVYGFLGMRLEADGLSFTPRLPAAWTSVALRVVYRGYRLNLTLTHDQHRIAVDGTDGRAPARVILNQESHVLSDGLRIASSPKARASA
jgi:trehalose/maltose hydrolase-like predicted phosphorylase